MGRKHKFNKFAQRKRDKKEQELNPKPKAEGDTRKHYEEIVRQNDAFEEYYKGQKIVAEKDWELFLNTMKENLPTAFRITGSKAEAEALLKVVKSQYFADILNNKEVTVDLPKNDQNLEANNEKNEEIKPFCLPWYPGGLAWQLRLSRTDIRRSPPLYRLHNFLVAETAAGGVSRQETVSMLPPVLLDVKPHHKVLDMCASPGSKTAQLIEFLHADEEKVPTGFVMANDVDNSRCYMLVHQAKRLNSPAILITNHDAAFMPALIMSKEPEGKETTELKFDRVLCDVPCSGDGTLRKNPDIWLKWSAGNGNNLHGVQYRILRRGCEVLAVGGRLVYSTCSLNPVENEAVVHRVLRETNGAVRLVDVADMVPGLVFDKGMTHWRPASKDMVFYDSYEQVPERWQTVVRPQMFPPSPDELDKYDLHKCIRILPQHQDTGAFFVAVFEKTAPLPYESKKQAEKQAEMLEDTITEETKKAEPPKKRRRMGGFREDPFVFFSGESEDVFPSIKEFYSLSNEFDPRCLLTRCHVGKKKNIYSVSPLVRDVVLKNEANIKIINTGVKTFVRCDNKNMKCAFRLSQEGLNSIIRYIGSERRVAISKPDLILVLQNDNPSTPPELPLFSQETQDRVKDLPSGSCVLDYTDPESGLELTLVGWRGVRSLRAYTATPDTVHMLRLLGADISKYDVSKFKKVEENQDASVAASKEESVVREEKEEVAGEVGNGNLEENNTVVSVA